MLLGTVACCCVGLLVSIFGSILGACSMCLRGLFGARSGWLCRCVFCVCWCVCVVFVGLFLCVGVVVAILCSLGRVGVASPSSSVGRALAF